jgi:hypothetical protein
MAPNDDGPSFFARYIDEPKKERQVETIPRGPLLRPIVPPSDSNSPPIEQLLDFLINRWSEPTINARIFGAAPAARKPKAC